MPRKCCGKNHRGPCQKQMGNLYRFVEPIILICLANLNTAHGYQIAQEAEKLAVTQTSIDIPVIYRNLRRLEDLGLVVSNWDTSNPGPAKREYTLTEAGWEHIYNWKLVLGDITKSLIELEKVYTKVLEKNKS